MIAGIILSLMVGIYPIEDSVEVWDCFRVDTSGVWLKKIVKIGSYLAFISCDESDTSWAFVDSSGLTVDTAEFAKSVIYSEYLWEYDGNGALMPTEVVISGQLWICDLGLDLMPTKGATFDVYWEFNTDSSGLVPKE